MSFSYISHLSCPSCGASYDYRELQQLCACGSPLLVRYRLDDLRAEVTPEQISRREPTLWRYHELLPVEQEHCIVSLGEGMTPLLKLLSLGANMSIPRLFMKDEGLLPGGSFKSRGAAVGVSKAKELGVRRFAMPSNGNAGAAWAMYAARAGIGATIVMPQDAPAITHSECIAAGAEVYLVEGLISDAGRLVQSRVAETGIYDASTLKEPYRIEGKKTMGLELAEQLGWKMPDVIVYPTGGGVGLIGIYKGLQELVELGWLEGPLPRFVAVQAEGCAPIVRAWEQRKPVSEFWEGAATAAFGINVPKALGDFLVLEALYATEGVAIAVSDQDLLEELHRAARMEGAFVCPEGAAALSAARVLRENGWIEEEDTVVVLNTGAGLKYPGTVTAQPPLIRRGEGIPG
ncbi:threonine synthase [Paenibacillus sp. CN-4]|uniref:threonine synthase n=1 Tax=Paenibacillus nanchangensis TaxID=3348343 RepID=UPI00397C5C66